MIPKELLANLISDPYYQSCARKNKDCDGRITFEHAIMYAGRQVQEEWAILPLCFFHHLGRGLAKKENVRLAMSRASAEDIKRFPRLNWRLKDL